MGEAAQSLSVRPNFAWEYFRNKDPNNRALTNRMRSDEEENEHGHAIEIVAIKR